MLRKFTYISLLCLTFGLLFIGCAKDEKTEEDPTGGSGTPTVTSSFVWAVNGGANVSANDHFFVSSFNNIVGKKTSNNSYVDITLDNMVEGPYTIAPSKGITLEYNDGSKSYYAISGTVNISSKSGNLLSGYFTANINSGGVNTVSGQFTDIEGK